MAKAHRYTTSLVWKGNKGRGTASYGAYGRDFDVQSEGKPVISGSSDPAFRGDATKYNPEDLLLVSLSSCHLLWYLHLCADAGVIVTAYEDQPSGTMIEDENGGRFTEVVLHPKVTVQKAAMQTKADELHHEAHRLCFIANSVNFPVTVEPVIAV